jgi:bacteriocin biosynthesis cyclodehydratase domain-containing protein
VTTRDHRDAGGARRGGVVDREGLLIDQRGAPAPRRAPRYRLRQSLELFLASDGNAYLLRPGSGDQYVIRAPSQDDRRVLRRLARGPVAIARGGTVEDRIAPLIEAGVVVPEPETDHLGDGDAQRFARQLPYLADFGDPHEVQQRLRNTCVAILGCGGLGSWTLGGLACLGIGRFVLVDDDAVELSNLNRQILYRERDVGAAKVDLAAAWTQAFDPATEVVAHRRRVRSRGAIRRLLSGCDLLVLTADWPPYEITRWANDACVAEGVPLLTAGQQPPLLRIGPTYLAGRGPCFACHEQQLRRDYPLYDELAQRRRRRPAEAMTLGPAAGVIGSLLALEVLALLVHEEPSPLLGRAMLLDMRSLETRWQGVEVDPDCPRCQRVSDG